MNILVRGRPLKLHHNLLVDDLVKQLSEPEVFPGLAVLQFYILLVNEVPYEEGDVFILAQEAADEAARLHGGSIGFERDVIPE